MPSFPIDRFLNIRSASSPSWSPDGRFVAFLTAITGVNQLWDIPITSGWPTQLTFTADSIRGGWFNPLRHELVFSMDTGGNEQTQLYHLYGVGGGTDHGIGAGWNYVDLTRQPEAVHYFGGWSHDGTRISFSANRANPSRFDIYVQTVPAQGRGQIEEPKLLHQGPGGYFTAAGWSPNDQYILARRVESNFNQDLYLIDVTTGQTKHITPHKGDVQYHSPSWAADSKSIYLATTADNHDMPGLAQLDIASGKLTYLETPPYEVESVIASPKGRWLAYSLNVEGKSELRIQALKEPAAKGESREFLGVVNEWEFAPDDSQLAYTFNGPRYNSDIWLWDLKSSKTRPLTHSSRAGIPFDQFVQPELIQYKTFDGRMIPAWFYKPKLSAGKLPPVIVYPHGGPESQTRPTFNALFQYFTQAGYAVLAPNVRGSSGYGTAYMNLDNTVKRMDSVKDLAHAAYWLRDEKQGDPKRLAVFGGSYGGFMVLAQVTNYPELWAAGINVVGIANFVTFLENTGAYRRAHREGEYGNLREHREFLEKISPINHVDKIQCPMLVIHGANDPRVPIGEAEQIVAALKKRNIPVEYLRYEDEGHGLGKLKNRLDAYPKMVVFLDRYLK
ncbi:MAG: alpha/beta fold hydrolase [Gemmataceae bacterium]